MTTETKLLGCIAQIALAGTVQATPSAGTVSASFIPDNDGADGTPNPLWVALGIVAEVTEKISSTEIEIYKPSPGTLSLADKKRSKFKREVTLKISECSNIMWLALRHALKSTSPRTGAIGQHVPLTGGTIKCWLKFQSYNQDSNTQELAEQVWCELSVDGSSYGSDKNPEFTCKFTQLWSALNSATGA